MKDSFRVIELQKRSRGLLVLGETLLNHLLHAGRFLWAEYRVETADQINYTPPLQPTQAPYVLDIQNPAGNA